MKRPWSAPRTTLGIQWAGARRDDPGSKIGWALVQTHSITEEARMRADDPFAAALSKAKGAIRSGEADKVDLYRYASESAFARSTAAAEGGNWATHCTTIDRLAEAMRQEGVPVNVVEVG